MYEEITKNKWKSFFLVFLFFIFVIVIGYLCGIIFQWGYFAVVMAVIIAIIMTLVSYYSGDKIVLSTSKARLAKTQEFPFYVHSVEGLAIAAGIPKPTAYVIDSEAMNAFATGKDPKSASVCVTTGLLKKLSREELEGVIAHELSHVKNYDIRIMMLAAVLVGILVILSDVMFRNMLWSSSSNNGRKGVHPVVMVIGLALIILSPFIANIIKLAISRKREFLADANGALLTRYPKGLADALRKISHDHNEMKSASNATAHLFISNPFKKGFTSNLFSTHPPIEERIKRLEKM
ncbi:M48 family metallopeptidase [Candidatus Woesearchaeota archaeon]|nr:M48 family metallopeptidase [Candidatus Woesearchaeota archaeon]